MHRRMNILKKQKHFYFFTSCKMQIKSKNATEIDKYHLATEYMIPYCYVTLPAQWRHHQP
jgi:hypothetical protein